MRSRHGGLPELARGFMRFRSLFARSDSRNGPGKGAGLVISKANHSDFWIPLLTNRGRLHYALVYLPGYERNLGDPSFSKI